LFYLCNWIHDRLYELGFTEAAGNFQSNNFGRGGLGNDALQADAQDGSGYNNANMSTPPDGSAPRMQMYIFTGPSPRRDGDLDAEVVLHEYTHGLSWRTVAGGQALGDTQSDGMGEGWSDFYGLTLLSEAGDDVNGVYGAGGYASYKVGGATDTQNYYFGIRRYPYSTDLTKNPLTFKDIDPAQADFCSSGAPFHSAMFGTCSASSASEVHNEGEVWCVTLWEARANIINKYGWAVGNQLILQLVTDGMKLTAPHPNFLQARNGILQADLVDTGGANQRELWASFAKRGMGFSATSPASSTTAGIHEAFDLPDDLRLTPTTGFASSGAIGGPFSPSCQTYTLANVGSNSVPWSAWSTQPWISLSATAGTLAPGASNTATVCLTAAANTLAPGSYAGGVIFSNSLSGVAQTRSVSLTVTPPRALFFSLDNDPGWTRQGQWAFGKPAGLGGTSFGNHDPTAGFTGTNVFGINLNGDYPTNIGGPYYLTAGPFDLSGYTGTQLAFQRWLNTDYQPFVYATVEISSNGSTWSLIWSNGTTTIADSAWTRYAYNISAFADRQSNVFIRWGHRVGSSGAFPFSGWNLDDIELLGTPSRVLTVNLPANATEGDGVLSGAGGVSISVAQASNVVVSLSSSDTTKLVVPPTVTILAGQTNAAFDLTIVDNANLDGTQIAIVSASTPGYTTGNAAMTVFDNESASLQVVFPGVISEGAGWITGTVQVSAVPTADITVSLSSSDNSQILLPLYAIIPAGQTSAVFTASIIDDTQIDAPQTVYLTAHVQNWSDGVAAVTILDDKNLNLVVTLPAFATEGDGILTNAGKVQIAGTLPTNLVVTLDSSNPVEASPPTTGLIPAGQMTGYFPLTIGHDPAITGPLPVMVTASAPGFVTELATITVLDYESPPMPANPAPAHLASNVPASLSLGWTGGTGVTNDIYFGTNAVPGPAQYVGSTTGATWVLPLLDPLTTYYWRVVARRGGTTPGPVWQFTTRGVDHFVWSSIASPQFKNVPIPVTITALDELGRPVNNYAGPANLSAWSGSQAALLFGDDFEDGSFADWIIGTDSVTRQITSATAAQGTNSFTITGGVINHYQGISHTLSNLMPSQITFSVRVSATNVAGGYFVVADAPKGSTAPANTAIFFYFNSGGTMGLIEEAGGWHGVPYLPLQWYKIKLVLDWTLKQMDFCTNDVLALAGVPFRAPAVSKLSIVHLYNYNSTQAWWDDIQFLGGNALGSVSITPTNSDVFVNGAWSGSVTALQSANSMYLRADDGSGHSGVSAAFSVLVQNDLILSMTGAPNSILVGSPTAWTNTIALTNTGPASATAVFVTNTFPASAGFVSASASQGSFDVTGNTIVFNVGDIAAANSGVFTLVVAPSAAGTITNAALVTRGEPDGDPSNNYAVTTTVILPPGMPPTITSQPANQTVPAGGSPVFTVTATGTAPLSYFWMRNAGPILGATSSTYTPGFVQLSDSGSLFSCLVSNAYGTALSSNALLTVTTNTHFRIAIYGADSVSWNADVRTNIVATGLFNNSDVDIFDATTNPLPTLSQLLQYGAVMIWTDGSFGNPTGFGNVLADYVDKGGGVVVGAYAWYATGSTIAGRLTNYLPLTQGPLATTVAHMTFVPDLASHPLLQGVVTFDGGTYSRRHTITPRAGTTLVAHWTDGLPLVAFNHLTNGTVVGLNFRPTSTAVNTFGWQAGTDGGHLLANAMYWAGGNMTATAPIITAQPTNQTVLVGGTATFRVSAWGASPLAYFWKRNGVFIPGATNSSYTTNNVQLAHSGTQFSCLVSNALGTALSSNAVLTVLAGTPPTITLQPVSQTVAAGSSVTFNVGATGSTPLVYFWRRNGVTIPGATTSTYTTNNVQVADSGSQFSCLVTNAYGSILSSNAVLTVTPLVGSTILSQGNLVITIDNLGARIYSVLFQGAELYRVGMFISDWGLQTGTDSTTFVRNENSGGTTGQPMTPVSSNTLSASYSGIYLAGGANVALTRAYALLPGSDVLRTVQTFTNNGSTPITLRCFDTFDLDWSQGGISFFNMYADRYLVTNASTVIQMGRGIMVQTNVVVILGTSDPAAVLAASATTYFGIQTSASLNSFFATGGADSDGASVDDSLDIGREFVLAPGAGAAFVFYQSVATNVPIAEAGILTGIGTNHPPIAASVNAGTHQDQLLSIGVDKLLALASDPDGDVLSVSAVSPVSTNGGPVILTTNTVTYTPPAGYLGSDRFTYTVTDGLGGLASAYVFVQVRSTNELSANLLPPSSIPGGWLISFAGIPGRAYTLQRADALSGPWLNLDSVTVSANGLASFADTNSPPATAYYRTVYP
jgi:uncharacterized repeat protein (TIGR01451 family)